MHAMRCKTVLSLFLCMLLLSLPVSALSSDGLLAVLTEGDADAWVAETLPTLAGNGEWYAIALAQGEKNYDFSKYAAALTAYFDTETIGSAVERQRIALALLAIGADSDIPDRVLSDSVGKQGTMSLVFALHLLQNGAQSDMHTVESVTAELLARQNEDGGWCVTGARSDADVTAMALQALAMQKETHTDAIGCALDCLSEMQKDDASFVSYGVSNAESCCQVIIALTALGIDPETDARFVKNGRNVFDALDAFRLPDGSYAHTVGGTQNSFACQQALLASVALERFASGKSGLYCFDGDAPVVPPETSDGSETESTEPSGDTSFAESSPETSVPASEPQDGISPLRVAVLILAAVVGLASLAYLLLGKNNKKTN